MAHSPASLKEVERQEKCPPPLVMDVAHEMRTPLTTMNGLLDGLKYNMVPESRQDVHWNSFLSETQRLIRLVNENPDYEDSFEPNCISANIVLQGLERSKTRCRTNCELVKVKIIHCAMNAIKTSVYADYDRFVQILANITKNANQFMDNGEILEGIGMKVKKQLSISDTWYRNWRAN